MNNFSKYEDQLNKTPQVSRNLYTGLTTFKVLGINPTLEDLSEIIGEERASKFDLSYSIREDIAGNKVRPITIWIQDVEEKMSPTIFTINIGDFDSVSQSGNRQILNDRFQHTYSQSIDTLVSNPNMYWFSQEGMEYAKFGIIDWYEFVNKLLRFDLGGEVKFLDFVEDVKLDFRTIYDGDFSGLHEFVTYATDKEMCFVGMALVKEKEGGEAFYQDFLDKPNFWFKGNEATDQIKEKVRSEIQKTEERGYKITTKHYSIDFKIFNPEQAGVQEKKDHEAAVVNSLEAFIRG